MTDKIKIIEITTDNVDQRGIYCIKNKKSPGYNKKITWFKNQIKKGLRINIATDTEDKQLGFIEYMPAEIAWRPIKAKNYFFIQCIALFAKGARNKSIGSSLLIHCEKEAKRNNISGICTMTSDGPWIANKSLFEKNGFQTVERLDRFELMSKPFNSSSIDPRLNNWIKQQEKYQGWNLIYADQCPWHEKSITDLQLSATEYGIQLKIHKLASPKEAQNAPSGFGTYSLVKDGKLMADHYISKTRFENILKQENQNP